MLTGVLAVQKQCTVFVAPQPENLEDYNGFAHATSDVDRKKSMKTIGIENEGDYIMAPSQAYGEYSSTAPRNFRTSPLS